MSVVLEAEQGLQDGEVDLAVASASCCFEQGLQLSFFLRVYSDLEEVHGFQKVKPWQVQVSWSRSVNLLWVSETAEEKADHALATVSDPPAQVFTESKRPVVGVLDTRATCSHG